VKAPEQRTVVLAGVPKELALDDLMALFARFGEVVGGGLEYTGMDVRIGTMGVFCSRIEVQIEELVKKNKNQEIKEDLIDKKDLKTLKIYATEVEAMRGRLELPEQEVVQRKGLMGSLMSGIGSPMSFRRSPSAKSSPVVQAYKPPVPDEAPPSSAKPKRRHSMIETGSLRKYENQLLKLRASLLARPVTPHTMRKAASYAQEACEELVGLDALGLGDVDVGNGGVSPLISGFDAEEAVAPQPESDVFMKERKQGKMLSISTGCGAVFFRDAISTAPAAAEMNRTYIQGPQKLSSLLEACRVDRDDDEGNDDSDFDPKDKLLAFVKFAEATALAL
jgi:hypothetical protein